MRIFVGICGSIAAYRSPDLIRHLRAQNLLIKACLSENAKNFVGLKALETFLGEAPVDSKIFADSHLGTDHIETARWADRILIYGATADFLAKIAQGRTDDFISLQISATKAPVFLAPAMNPSMWQSPANQTNIRILQERGFHFIGPEQGVVACGEEGLGHVSDFEKITHSLLSFGGPLSGKRVLITAGPMRTALDPMRFIQNGATGEMGVELALAAKALGAVVTLILGPVDSRIQEQSKAFRCLNYKNFEEYKNLLSNEFKGSDIFISNAAVLDFEVEVSTTKLKRKDLGTQLNLNIHPTEDIVATLSQQKTPKQKLVAFSAETGDIEQRLKVAEEKLKSKKVDFLIENALGQSSNAYECVFLSKGQKQKIGPAPKSTAAKEILSQILKNPN